eukprot:TRINITY_DN735_c0_g1_i3.p1 TRINITY_DN735_c0_g1~~TRINITY_DN735_c0_g1_i3.p1  ORF type:complete len:558 (+),score=127.81 TRINITY_DN735_c0_g1_i3:41-1675(+)
MESTDDGESAFRTDDEFMEREFTDTAVTTHPITAALSGSRGFTEDAPAPSSPVPVHQDPTPTTTTTSTSARDSAVLDTSDFDLSVDASSSFTSPASPVIMRAEDEDVMHTPVIASPPRQGQDWLEISVTDPEKFGDGINGYIAYRVQTKTTLPSFKSPENTVIRRYNDFLWLFEQLHETRGILVPPVPDKGIISRFSPEFIEFRRKELDKFLNRVARHPRLYLNPAFRAFLESDEQTFAQVKSQSKAKVKPAEVPQDAKQPEQPKKSGMSFSSIFGNISSLTSATISGVKEVDPWIEARKLYLTQLEAQLVNLGKFASALTRKKRETAMAFNDFAAAASLLAHCEADQDPASSGLFTRLQQISDSRHDLNVEVAKKEETCFEDAIRDYLRMLQAVKDMLADRADVLMDYSNATRQLEGKKERFDKMQKSGKGKTADLEREIEEATRIEQELKRQFEEVSARCREELALFDRTRQWEMRRVIKALAQANLEHSLLTADLYKNFTSDIHKSEEDENNNLRPDNVHIHQGEVERAGWGGNWIQPPEK